MIELNKEKEQHLLVNVKILGGGLNEVEITKNDKVIDIGAANGGLTEELAKKAKEVLAFETDVRFKEDLDRLSKKYTNIKLIYGNALDYSWQGFNKIVSNIPFSLSAAIIERAIVEDIEELNLIVGEHFKELLDSNEKIGLITRLFFYVKPITELDKKNFFPEPKVKSWLVKLKLKKDVDETLQDRILKKIVMDDRKIKNSVIYAFVAEGFTKNQARDFILKQKFEDSVLDKPTNRMTGKFMLRLRDALENLPIKTS